MNNTGMNSNKKGTVSPAQANAAAIGAILTQGTERLQPLPPISITAAQVAAGGNIVNVQPQNVGLIRGFLVKISGTLTNGSGSTATRTQFGASNLLGNIVFTDTNNQVRHQTQGWHMGLVNSARQPMVFGAAYSPNVPVNYGNNWTVQSAASTIAASTDAAVQFYYYIPLSYSKTDLRGAMWAGITNAVAQLQLTVNANPFVASGDATDAVYSGNAGAWKTGSSITISVWQDYIDQIPYLENGQPFLPAYGQNSPMSTLYCLQSSTLSGLVANQDYGVTFANWREFLSTSIVYDNAGVLNTGSDINYFALTTANTSQLWKFGPSEAALLARTTFLADPPNGCYYFDSRRSPINTQQFGNMQISVNPATVTNSTSNLRAGWEYMTQASQVVGAQSLPTGG